MPTIYLSSERYKKLCSALIGRGYKLGRGPNSQIGEFIESLIDYAPVEEYNSIFEGLKSIGLRICSDARDGDSTWHYQWKRGKIVRGFSTPAAALIAAFQDRHETR